MQSKKDSPLPMTFTWSGSRNSHGIAYERDLALTLFVAASLEERSFHLATEMNVAGKFDDAVLILDDRKEVWFYQAKHSQTTHAEIKFEEFFPSSLDENSQFSLPMYIQSFLNVSQRSEFKNYKKRFIIYSNKSIEENTRTKLGKLLRIQDCAVNAPLEKKVYIRNSENFVPTADQILDLLHKINKLPVAIKDAIIDLQQSGTVKSILRKYTTPLRSILEIDGAVRFSEKFTEHEDDINQQWLWNELQTHFTSKRLSEVEFHGKIDKRMLQNKSGETSFPRFIKESDLRSFFDCLVICTNQPDKLFRLRDSITESAVAEWIHEKDLGLFSDRTKFHAIFENEFDIWHMVTNMDGNQKPFLSSNEGNKCVHMAKAKVRRTLQNFTEADFNNYVERKLVFENKQEELTEDGFISILERSSGRNDYYILVGEPGMGKTTFMKKITYSLQTDFNKHVYLICLRRLFKNYEAGNNMFSLIQSAISKSIQQLIQNSLECCSQQCFILLDGFDEIDSSHQGSAIKLIKETFCKSNIRVFISSRNHLKETLEKDLQAKALNLVPLVENEQLLLLRNYWDISSGINEKDFDRFQRFANHLLETLHDNIQSAYFRFTGLPLMIRMLAEVYKKKFEEYWQSSNANITDILDSKTRFSVLHLYENFVNISFNVFVRKIINEEGYATVDSRVIKFFKENLEKFNRAHQLIAINQLNICELRNLLSYDESATILENMQQILDNGEKSLLFNVSNENQLEFTHLSFAEYFHSKFLYEHVSECEAVLFKVLVNHKVVRAFFFSMVEENWKKSALQMNTINRICHKNPEIMYLACSDGYESILKELLNHHNPRVIFWTHRCSTLLHAAVKSKKENILKLVLCEYHANKNTMNASETKININTPNSSGLLPIHNAASDGNKPFVKMLAQYGADKNIDAQDIWGTTPLHYAAKKEDWEMIKILTDYGATTNIRDQHGHTILRILAPNIVKMMNGKSQLDNTSVHPAAIRSKWEIVKGLIGKFNADYATANEDEINFIHVAAKAGNTEIVKVLLRDYAIDINAQDSEGNTPLHYAARNNKRGMAKMLINKYNADCKIANNDGHTSLHLVAKAGYTKFLRMLIDDYATDVNAQDSNGNTPLHLSVHRGGLEMVKMLIDEYNADYRIANNEGQTLIHYAASEGKMRIVKILVDNYATDLNTPDNNGNIPLHYIARTGNREMVEMLFDKAYTYSADYKIANNLGQTIIHLAALEGTIEILQMFLDAYGIDVNTQDNLGDTPLHYAALRNKQNMVKMLIDEYNADYKIANKDGQTLIHYAAEIGNMAIVKMLIEDYVPDINAQDNKGNTPLHFIVSHGKPEMFKMLFDEVFKYSADYKIANKQGQTIIHSAARRGDIEMLQMFIDDCAADVNMRDNYGSTPLHHAVRLSGREMVKFLIDKYNADYKIANERGQILIHEAATHNALETVKMLIEDYATDVNAQDNDGNTPLHLASVHSWCEIVEMLINEYNADYKIANKNGQTLIHYAAAKDNKKIVMMLIDDYAIDVNTQDRDGNTPLHIAARQGKQEMVKMLIDKYKADYTIANKDGQILIHCAAQADNVGIVNMLIGDYAADVNAENNEGNTPLHYAALHHKREIVKLLINKYNADYKTGNKNGQTLIHLAAVENDMEILQLLIGDYSADVNAQDVNGNTPLNYALFHDKREFAKMLIDKCSADHRIINEDGLTAIHYVIKEGIMEILLMLIDDYSADVNARDSNGNTLLHYAAFYGKREIAKTLIEKCNADYTIFNNDGLTPFHCAAEEGNLDIVKMLIDDYAADVNAQNIDGNTPLRLAAANSRWEMVKMLIIKYNANFRIRFFNFKKIKQ